MSDCEHTHIRHTHWKRRDGVRDLWACEDCGQHFVPIESLVEASREGFEAGLRRGIKQGLQPEAKP